MEQLSECYKKMNKKQLIDSVLLHKKMLDKMLFIIEENIGLNLKYTEVLLENTILKEYIDSMGNKISKKKK